LLIFFPFFLSSHQLWAIQKWNVLKYFTVSFMQCSKDNICPIGSSFTLPRSSTDAEIFVHYKLMMNLQVANVTNLQRYHQWTGLGNSILQHFFFMAPLLWWSIEESSYQVLQVSSHSVQTASRNPFRCMQDTCVTHAKGLGFRV
jgi:hypothetical protein